MHLRLTRPGSWMFGVLSGMKNVTGLADNRASHFLTLNSKQNSSNFIIQHGRSLHEW